MAIFTKGNDYIIDLNSLMFKVECYNMQQHIRVDSFEVMRLMLKLAIHNNIVVIENDAYYKCFKSDNFDELLVELADEFYLTYGLGCDVDYRYSDDKIISYNIAGNGELVLSIKKLIGIQHEDLDDLLKEL